MGSINCPNMVWKSHGCKDINKILSIAKLYNPVQQYLFHGITHLHDKGPQHLSPTQVGLLQTHYIQGVTSFQIAMATYLCMDMGHQVLAGCHFGVSSAHISRKVAFPTLKFSCHCWSSQDCRKVLSHQQEPRNSAAPCEAAPGTSHLLSARCLPPPPQTSQSSTAIEDPPADRQATVTATSSVLWCGKQSPKPNSSSFEC